MLSRVLQPGCQVVFTLRKLSGFLIQFKCHVSHLQCIGRIKLQNSVRKMGHMGTDSEKIAIQERRRKLKQRIVKFHRQANGFYSLLDDNIALGDDGDDGIQPELEADGVEEDDADEEEEIKPESLPLRMPCSMIEGEVPEYLQKLADQELQLRKGQANDALRQLRLLVGHKSLVYETAVRNAGTTRTRTRAWTEVKNLEDKLKNHADIYRSARRAMVQLQANAETLRTYQELVEKDLSVSKDVLKQAAARTGQRNDVLSWIWRLDGQNVEEGDDWMDECKYTNNMSGLVFHNLPIV